MKKALKWVGIFFGVVVLGTVIKYGIPLMFAVLLVTGLESEWYSLNDPAESTLTEIGLNIYTEYAPCNALTIAGSFTAFELPKYDNHTDNTNLHEGIMKFAAKSNEWYVEETTTAEYIDALTTYIPETAFLYPKNDLTFDAKYIDLCGTEPAKLAFFDLETGLIIYLCTYNGPPLDNILRINQLSIPHNGYMYELETHGGFFGDGTTYQALIVPEAERPAFEATLAAHTDWHVGSITHAEYVTLHDREFYALPSLYPAADTTFDWWCYVNTFARNNPDFESDYIPDNSDFPAVMQDAGARPSGNWLVAFYDADSGLFIFYQYDS